MGSMQTPGRRMLLLVEDDLDIRETFAEILEDEGFQVATAANGADAVEYLRRAETLPRLIVLDLMMPVMDGIQFWREQQREARWASIPVVVMSANSNLSEMATEIRPAGVLRKPIDMGDLLTVIDAVAGS